MARLSKELSYGAVHLYSDQILGIGSYGKVCKAKCGQLPCAAKLLHDTLSQYNNSEMDSLTRKFEEECQFLSTIKHPNIVQHLQTSRDPALGRQVLLMELMDESLTKFLERSTGPLPYHIQINICHDVALALSYLHLNSIMHRDLSSNNVLLIGEGSRAKVADFGMSKLLDLNPHMTPLSQCPGTPAYMPPEALITPPHYTYRLDCFSHGVLTIQIVTKRFPDPGDATTVIDISDKRFPTGRAFVPIPEIDRRKEDIDLMEMDHSLKQIALDCLKDRDMERPPADELCERLDLLMREAKFTDSLVQNEKQTPLVKKLEVELEAREETIKVFRARMLEHGINQEEYIGEEEKSDGAMAESSLDDKPIPSCRHQTPEVSLEGTDVDAQVAQHSDQHGQNRPSGHPGRLSLTWSRREPAPENITSMCSSATLHDNTVYVSEDYTIHCYKLRHRKWKTVMEHTYKGFSLVVVNDRLTTVGGYSNDGLLNTYTNLLLTLVGSGSSRRLEKILPPMPTHRHCQAAITTPTHLVVVGGRSLHSNALFTVEAMDTETLQWSTAESLPQAARYPKVTLCDGHLYVSNDNVLYSCTAERFIRSCQPPSEEYNSSTRNRSVDSVWSRLADIPIKTGSALATLGGHVLAIGGRGADLSISGAVHCYDRTTNSWHVVGEQSVARYDTLSVCLTNNELLVVGGHNISLWSASDICEVGRLTVD